VSLRFRLPALFLAGVVLSGLVASALAFRLFDDYTRSQALKELRREAQGITNFYAENANQDFKFGQLEHATGDRIFYVPIVPGLPLVPGNLVPFPGPPSGSVDKAAVRSGKLKQFEFKPAGGSRTYLAVAQPLFLGKSQFGTMIVAKPKTELTSRLATLFERLAVAFGVGIAIAGGLGVYLSRRITEPVLALAHAADQVAAGNYDVEIAGAGTKDEVGQLAARFQEMARRLGEAEQRERNFLMTVSHELRTPLTAIRGHVAALREGVAENPELAAASLEVISLEAARLERLVGDVLDLAKLDAHRFTVTREEVDMERLCEQAYTAFAEEARRRGIDYRREQTASPVIESDGDRVLQIITNLLSNAFRWTPDGGRIQLSLESDNGSVSVSVRDTGPGIPAVQRERIFRPFFSGDNKGTGLGLAISKELAGALGGTIRLESTDGLGSRFELVLPASH
jgi:two-component system OmpR family sensor kinase